MIDELIEVEIKAYMLVRDASGKPKIDGDPKSLPKSIKNMLTKEEMAEAVKMFKEMQNGSA